jgi:pimeloyl-ACP methyl ester carboxylesterase
MAVFEYRSIPFHYSDVGKGPAIVFLHGFLENRSMWGKLQQELPSKYRKICLDLPGHGDSGNIGYIHTMEEMADVVKSLTDHLKLKKFFILGHSMGGYVALALAEKHPDCIRGMLLMNSTSRADSDKKKRDRNRSIQLAKRDHKSYIRKSIPNLFRPKNREVFRKELNQVKKEALKTSKQGIIAAIEGMKVRNDREVLLHFSPYPVLFIAAQRDPILIFEDLQEQLKAEKVVAVVTENGHMSHIEDFDTLFKGIKTFLSQNS